MRTSVEVAVAFALVLGTATLASAQATETCVLLPRPDETDAPAATWESAETALSTALRERGLIVLSARDAQLRMMGQSMEHCAAIDCAPEVNQFLGTTMAVHLELTWVRGRLTALHVALVGLAADRSAGGEAGVDRGVSIDDAVRTALAAAWDRWAADQQGQLTVTSAPEGAFVELDGTSLGRTPVRRLVPAGIHSLRVTLEGYATDTREITIDAHETRDVAVELRSTSVEAMPIDEVIAAPVTRTEDRAHWANWLLGGGLVLGSVGLAIRPLDALAREGQNVGTAAMPQYVVFDGPLDGTLLGLSVACLLGGVAFFVFQPIRETVTIEATAGGLRSTIRF